MFTSQTHVGPRAPRCHILWEVPENRGPHCKGRQRRLPEKQSTCQAVRRARGTLPICTYTHTWAREGGPGTRGTALPSYSAPQKEPGIPLPRVKILPQWLGLATGNLRINPEDNEEMTQIQRPKFTASEASHLH